jgi:hypothetical protein
MWRKWNEYRKVLVRVVGFTVFCLLGALADNRGLCAMTDYNNGQIHGWNGGDCPVHPETVVSIWHRNGLYQRIKAGVHWWGHRDTNGDIIAFQVVKAYVEPKVIWVNEYLEELVAHPDEQSARDGASTRRPPRRIAVKYVECIADAKEAQDD